MADVDQLSERQAYLVLNALPNVGPVTVSRLLEEFGGDPRALLRANGRRLQAVSGIGEAISRSVTGWPESIDLEREESRLSDLGAEYLTPADASYPKLLRELRDAPVALYRRGPLTVESPAVAMVGTRRPTLYGRGVARQLSSELAKLGFTIVSGLARGVDREAHEGALGVDGKTVAVLGCGIDVVYPPENADITESIGLRGALMSEFSLGTRPDRQTFPRRNRLISGMVQGVIVIESDTSGGSMITARFAADQGKQVFAVPGRIDQASARGCHQLIREGATLVSCVEDIVSELRFQQLDLTFEEHRQAEPAPTSPPVDLSPEEEKILESLKGGETLHPDALVQRTGLPQHAISAGLLMLELKRLVGKRSDGTFERRFRS